MTHVTGNAIILELPRLKQSNVFSHVRRLLSSLLQHTVIRAHIRSISYSILDT